MFSMEDCLYRYTGMDNLLWTIVHTGITVKTNYINGKDTFMNFLFLLWVAILFHVPHKKKNTKSSKAKQKK